MAGWGRPTKKKNTSGNWLLWWQIDPAELEPQVEKYDQLNIHQSARGIALLLFVASAVLTALVIELSSHDRWGYLDAGVFLGLGAFIYFGHRWAMILSMILWTGEKAMQLVSMFQTGHFANPIGILIFWGVFMHAMYLAFRVEQSRRQGGRVLNPAVFD